MMIPARDRLIVALDVPDVVQAERLVARLGASVSFYKIGLELIYGGGLDLVARLAATGAKVFLDAKLHDIPNTTAAATAQAARLGATFLTVHAFPKTLRAAAEAARDTDLRLLAVTVLTSDDDADVEEAGYRMGAAELVMRRCHQARAAGVDGLVMSPLEVAVVRADVGPDVTIVTPGVRPSGSGVADQKRVMTPREAIRAGADHIVVGRPIAAAADPRAAAEAITAEITAALGR